MTFVAEFALLCVLAVLLLTFTVWAVCVAAFDGDCTDVVDDAADEPYVPASFPVRSRGGRW